MAEPRVYRTEAIVLRQRPLGDAAKILVMLTPEHGRLEAVARGVRRTRSRLAGHVEPLTHASLLLARGGKLDIVTQAQIVESFQALRQDLELLSRAFYVAELVERLVGESEENYPLFRLVLDTLTRLAQVAEPDVALRYFEMRVLDLLGYRPQIDRCAVCNRALEAETNLYSPLAGGALCTGCVPANGIAERLSVNALKWLRVLQRAPFAEVARVRLPESVAFEVERHLRGTMQAVLEREVRSGRFLDRVRRTGVAATRG